MIKAVLFDLDGTLIDSEYRCLSIKCDLLRKRGFNVDQDLINNIAGKKFNRIIPKLFPDYADLYGLINEYQHLAYDYVNYKDLEMANATKVLKKLKENYILALVTASNRSKISEVIKQLGWDDLFQVIIDADSHLEDKPSPQYYLKAMELLDLTAEDCVVVEDSYVGIKAAKKAGIKVIAKRENRYYVDQSNADELIDDLSELLIKLEVE